ncbi:MAG: response regulator transcription factor [Arcobacteraceae bacterium]
MKVLLLEDDIILNELVEEFLISIGHTVTCAYDGIEALDTIYEDKFDMLLLDVGIPSMSGFELLSQLREQKITTPTIFLTSLSDIASLEKGFNLGCDDYIKKPFELKELEIRMNHLKVIKKIDLQDIVIVNEKYKYDFSKFTIIEFDDKKTVLSKKESKILEYFLKNENRTISLEELIGNIWQYDETPTNATIRTYIKNLRKILDEDIIVTTKGLGYKFEN